jgi:hypothetical protein
MSEAVLDFTNVGDGPPRPGDRLRVRAEVAARVEQSQGQRLSRATRRKYERAAKRFVSGLGLDIETRVVHYERTDQDPVYLDIDGLLFEYWPDDSESSELLRVHRLCDECGHSAEMTWTSAGQPVDRLAGLHEIFAEWGDESWTCFGCQRRSAQT